MGSSPCNIAGMVKEMGPARTSDQFGDATDHRDSHTPWRLTTAPTDVADLIEDARMASDWAAPTRLEARGAGFAATELRPSSRAANDGGKAVGYRLDPQHHELLVSCGPAEALQQQFDQHGSEFVAVHDLGSHFSRRLLAGVAAAGHRPLQQLHVRRRGSGETLAILHFLELPTSEGLTLRFYTTDVDASPLERQGLVRTLLANARMAAVMVSERALHDPQLALRPLADELAKPPWPNRHWIFLPMQPDAALGRQLGEVSSDFAVRNGLQSLTTPVVRRPSEAWLFLQSTFTRLKNEGTLAPPKRQADLFTEPESRAAAPGAPGASTSRDSAQPTTSAIRSAPGSASVTPPVQPETQPVDISANGSRVSSAVAEVSGIESVGGITAGMGLGPARSDIDLVSQPSSAATVQRLGTYLQRVAQIAGADTVCLFERASGHEVAHVGTRPDARLLARHGSALLSAVTDASRGLGLASHAEGGAADLTISLRQHHLLIHPVPGESALALHIVLDRSASNLMLTRVQLQRLDDELMARHAATASAPAAAAGR